MRRILLSVWIGAGVVSLAGCEFENFVDSDRFKEDFSYSYPLKSGGKLSVENFNGSVEITGWEKDSVQVTGTKNAATEELLQAIKIDIVPSADAVRIRTIRPSERRGNMGARYVIRVPFKTELERVESSNGQIRVEGVEGMARLRSSNGSVKVWKAHGPLEATTSNASIDVQEFSGSAVLKTSNGSIKADGIRGYFEATTSNASIDARLLEIEGARPIKLGSSNGSITLALEALKGNDIIANTSNAGITVKLPSAIGAQVKASTTNSSITTDFDVSVRGTQSKNQLEGTIGSGGPTLDLSTSNGSIKLLRL